MNLAHRIEMPIEEKIFLSKIIVLLTQRVIFGGSYVAGMQHRVLAWAWLHLVMHRLLWLSMTRLQVDARTALGILKEYWKLEKHLKMKFSGWINLPAENSYMLEKVDTTLLDLEKICSITLLWQPWWVVSMTHAHWAIESHVWVMITTHGRCITSCERGGYGGVLPSILLLCVHV